MGRWIRNTVAQIDMFLAGAELGLSSTYDFGEATPTPTPPGREGQNKMIGTGLILAEIWGEILKRARENGFTLIELLVVIAIFKNLTIVDSARDGRAWS